MIRLKLNSDFDSKTPLQFFTRFIVLTLAILLSAFLMPGVEVTSLFSALIASLILAFLNTFLRPILIFLTLPLTFLSLGVFLLFINAFIVFLTSKIVSGFDIKNFWIALLYSIVISLISSLLEIPRRFLNGGRQEQIDEVEQVQNENTDFDEYEELDEEGNKKQ